MKNLTEVLAGIGIIVFIGISVYMNSCDTEEKTCTATETYTIEEVQHIDEANIPQDVDTVLLTEDSTMILMEEDSVE
ncbi:MAG: hypothetical protein CMD22_02495 [Flavobacteriales bacterium]|nr:hypothetical protein [Flavobacteriales bacterium]|tara:strand:- start:2984 stop:3214 length:231 start_codon:yes stop_codon:yes gene_type:complete